MTAVPGHSPGGATGLLNLSPAQDLPLGNHVFTLNSIDLVVHVDTSADMVRNHSNLVTDFESGSDSIHTQVSVLLGKIDNLDLGILYNVAKAPHYLPRGADRWRRSWSLRRSRPGRAPGCSRR